MFLLSVRKDLKCIVLKLISHLHKILVSDWLMNYESFLNTVQLINSTHPGTLHVDLVSFHRNTHIYADVILKGNTNFVLEELMKNTA